MARAEIKILRKMPTRKDIIEIAKIMGYQISHFEATEAMVLCRGKDLEDSSYFNIENLVEWILKNDELFRFKMKIKVKNILKS
jgi:hypothetical protein